MENGIVGTETQNIITFFKTGENPSVIFTLSMNEGKIYGSTEEPEAINEAARLFFEQLKIQGQTLLDKINAVKQLAAETPNDMELGNKLRKLLNTL